MLDGIVEIERMPDPRLKDAPAGAVPAGSGSLESMVAREWSGRKWQDLSAGEREIAGRLFRGGYLCRVGAVVFLRVGGRPVRKPGKEGAK